MRASAIVAAALWSCGASAGVGAQYRVFNTFGQESGLTATPVWAVAQDSVGFLWIGAEGGLFRFDGREIRRWAEDRITAVVLDVAVAPDGRVVALGADGGLFEVEGRTAREIAVPEPRMAVQRRPGRTIAFDRSGRLWIHRGDSVVVRGPEGRRALGASALGGVPPTGLLPTDFGGVLVITAAALWRVGDAPAPTRLFARDVSTGEVIVGAVEPAPGRVLILLNVARDLAPRVVERTEDSVRELVASSVLPPGRAVAIRERKGTVWLAADLYMAVLRPGERPEVLDAGDGYESGGPLMVDREGSLWLGSFVGLHQYPEPDAAYWTEREGLPSRHTRFLAATEGVLWVMTWGGPSVLRLEATERVAVPLWDTRSNVCDTPDGRAWTASDGTVLELRGASTRAWPGIPVPIHGCTRGRAGGVWIGSGAALAFLDPEVGTPIFVEPPHPERTLDPRPALLHDRQGELWVGAGEDLCHASAAQLLEERRAPWSCETVGGPDGIEGVAEVADGRRWIAAGPAGLMEEVGGTWRPLMVEGVAAQSVHALVPSPRGGVWIVGDAMLVRARPASGSGLEVVERLTPWHGLSAPAAGDLWESPQGDLWLATNQGLAHVPPSVRFSEPLVPRVVLVDGRVDDRSVSLDEALTLPHDRNRVELRFAALAFKDRGALRHEVRLSAAAPWTRSTGDPSFRWVDLPPGAYRAEYRASHDGRSWSGAPARFTFVVRPPWYATVWFLLLSAAGLAALVVVVYRGRVGYLVGLEQQRTRISMDLHDQVGSGLASVGILSELVAEGELSTQERRRTAREIADVADELGQSLSDIVWSLDAHMDTMEELATRLTEHGDRLFPDERVRFEARVPDSCPPARLSVPLRRAVLLIGLEALHNAARHAEARRVTLTLEPLDRREWRLVVEDDGRGPGAADEHPRHLGGRGVPGMHRRAASIGAELSITSAPGTGTTVTLRFRPGARTFAQLDGLVRRLFDRVGRIIMRGRGSG